MAAWILAAAIFVVGILAGLILAALIGRREGRRRPAVINLDRTPRVVTIERNEPEETA